MLTSDRPDVGGDVGGVASLEPRGKGPPMVDSGRHSLRFFEMAFVSGGYNPVSRVHALAH